MKLTNELLRSKAGRNLSSTVYLDLSNLEIERIEKVHLCSKLEMLNLRGNDIDYVSNLEGCTQLWYLDLGHNQICNLEGLKRFVAMGTLLLNNNQLRWAELAKIRHIHILKLSLHSNLELEKDTNYRIHVINCLPNVWELDGKIITSTERVQVRQFFEDSALTDKPVRPKLSSEKFIPSSLKKIEVNGIFGHRTDHLLRRFPLHETQNIGVDRRRVQYIAYNLLEDLKLEFKYVSRNRSLLKNTSQFLESVEEIWIEERVKTNVLLLLLLASLQFAIPRQLMEETLLMAQMCPLRSVNTMELFLLSRETRCLIVSLLLNLIKVEKDIGEDVGTDDKLYLCLYYSVYQLTKLAHGGQARGDPIDQQLSSLYVSARGLIAAEVVQLLCLVPAFLDYVTANPGVINLLVSATANQQTVYKIIKVTKQMEQIGWSKEKIFEKTMGLLQKAVRDKSHHLTNKDFKQLQEGYVLKTCKALPRRPKSALLRAEYHAAGMSSPHAKTVRLKSGKPERRPYIPQACLGERVLLGPQNIAKIMSIPEPDLALVQMSNVPSDTGAMQSSSCNAAEHYEYVDLNTMYWDQADQYWKPSGTYGDRITMQSFPPTENEIIDKELRFEHNEMEVRYCVPPTSPRLDRKIMSATSRSLPVKRDTSSKQREESRPISSKLKRVLEQQSNKDNASAESARESKLTSENDNCRQDKEAPISESGCEAVPEATRQVECGASTELDVQPKVSNVTETSSVRGNLHSSAVFQTTLPSITDGKKPPDQKINVPKDISHSESGDLQSEELSAEVQCSNSYSKTVEAKTVAPAKNDIYSPFERSQRPLTEMTHQTEHSDYITAGHKHPINERNQIEITPSGEKFSGKRDENVFLQKQKGLCVKVPTTSGQKRNPISPRSVQLLDYLDDRRLVVGKDKHEHASPFQTSRTDIWKSAASLKTNEPRARSPPPQRPSSPITGKDTKVLQMQKGNQWLGGGKDLFLEAQRNRPKSAHSPGWMDGMTRRPKSAAAKLTSRGPPLANTMNNQTSKAALGAEIYYSAAEILRQLTLAEGLSRDHIVRAASASSYRRPHTPPSNRPSSPDFDNIFQDGLVQG